MNFDFRVLIAALLLPIAAAGAFRETVALPPEWKLSGPVGSEKPFAPADPGFAAPELDDSDWKTIPVPLDWFRRSPGLRDPARPYVRGFYRVALELPDFDAGRAWLLRFEEVGYAMTLFVNGREAGGHRGDFTPAEFEISRFLRPGRNVIAVQVETDFGPKYGAGPAQRAMGDQWSIASVKGGIWGKTTLTRVPKVRVGRIFATPRFDRKAVELEIELENPQAEAFRAGLEFSARSAVAGREVPVSTGTLTVDAKPGRSSHVATLPLTDPVNWSPRDPFLYRLEVKLTDGDKICDIATERFGFREFKTEGRNFYLNGERVYLFAENLASNLYGGREKPDTEELRNAILKYKKAGYVILRTPHQPIVPEALDLADELGMMIVDEWAWAFSQPMDEQIFPENNRREIIEWVRRDYNHPSVVMWSGGNEVFCPENTAFRVRELNREVALIKSLDKSGRPVSVMDGAAGDYGAPGLVSDVLVNHNYAAYTGVPWSRVGASVAAEFRKSEQVFGKAEKPFFVGECVGFSWGNPARDYPGGVCDRKGYLKLAALPSSWGDPTAPVGAALCGIRSWVKPRFGLRWGRNMIGKRVMEAFRLTPEIQGFAPWFQNPDVENCRIWNAPQQTFAAELHRNGMAGGALTGELAVVNDSSAAAGGVRVALELVRLEPTAEPFYPPFYLDASEPRRVVQRRVLELGELAPFEHRKVKLDFPLPADLATGDYRFNLITTGQTPQGAFEAVNFYDSFVLGTADAARRIASGRPVGVLDFGGAEPVERALRALGLAPVRVKEPAGLAAVGVLIVPPDAGETLDPAQLPLTQGEVESWIRTGGRLLVLEQSRLGSSPYLGRLPLTRKTPNAFVDPVLPEHPVFLGLTSRHFDGWDGGDRLIVDFTYDLLDDTSVAASGPRLGYQGITSALLEGRFGAGSITASQLLATPRFGRDAAATRFFGNLIDYLVNGELFADTPEWKSSPREYLVGARRPRPLDLTRHVNRALADEVDGDGKGGWTDQGENDLRELPTGSLTLGGVPYSVIGGDRFRTPAAVVLGGAARSGFPRASKGIPVGGKVDGIAFLQGCCWGARGAAIGSYRIDYADGSDLTVPLTGGVNIGDWWKASDLPGARVVWSCEKKAAEGAGIWAAIGWIGLYGFVWENPYPEREVTGFDFVSTGVTVPFLLAATALEVNPDALEIESPNVRKGWNTFWDPRRDAPVNVPSAVSSPDAFFGRRATKLSFPAGVDRYTPVAFVHFKDGLSKLDPAKHKRLSFWVNNRGPASTLVVELPRKDWTKTARFELSLSGSGWRRVAFDLEGELAKSDIALADLRGELFFRNVDPALGKAPAVEFFVADIKLD